MPLSPQELLRLEKSTLEKIATLKPFEAFTQLRAEALKMRRNIDPNRGGMNFHAVFPLKIAEQKPNRKVEIDRRFDVAGLIEVATDRSGLTRSCYQLVIGRSASHTKPILRKLHFDFEPVDHRDMREPKPSIHLQMGGELLPQWANGQGYDLKQCHHIYPWFEKPRIPCFPVCLALLLDWIFLEFAYNHHAAAVLKNAEWNAHVLEAETTLLAPFLNECQVFMKTAKAKKHRFLQQHLYAMPA